MSANRAAAITPFRGLLEAVTLVRTEHDLPEALDRIATVVAEALGFRTVIINLYRRAWADLVASTVFGREEMRRALAGSTYEWSWWERIFDRRFERRGTCWIPEGSFDWAAHTGGERFVPPIDRTVDETLWHQEDELFVPFYDSAGSLLGIFCVGEPVSGLRPTDGELDLLSVVAGHAGIAVEAAQKAVAEARQRRALEHLLRVSSELTDTTSAEAILDSVPGAIKEALGFQKVCVMLADTETGVLTARAVAGWELDDDVLRSGPTSGEIAALLDPEFESEGCFLLPNAVAAARIADRHHTYRSTLNGRGPDAWSNHWLLVPLNDRSGRLLGIIWVDEPADRLLPSRDVLQALRVFANQATTALECAADFAELRELSTARAELLEAEREQVARLQELDRMKDDFVALVSHELRTPLTSIRGYTELLLDEVESPEQRDFLNVVERNAQRLLGLVSDLLLIAEIQNGKLTLELDDLELDELVQETGKSARPIASANEIVLTVRAEPGLVVRGDRFRLGQVLDNLLSNAVKFTPVGGTVDLILSAQGETARVEVSDSGIGIPRDEQARIFGRFFRSTTSRTAAIEGTGLGLAITQGIVQSHGGTIGFRSEEGLGTTFTVELPLVARGAAPAREPALAV
jgi:signal transduction histidine kinase